jgi:carbon monoxide dehydrogenase subunit G
LEFSGETELEGVEVRDIWLLLADPVAIRQTIPGCELIIPIEDDDLDVDDLEEQIDQVDEDELTLPHIDREVVEKRCFQEGETYGVYMNVGVAGLNLDIRAKLDIVEREFPKMVARGGGGLGDYTFEMDTAVEISETQNGSKVKWSLDPEVSGSIFKWGSRLATPIFRRVVNRFFGRIEKLFKES